MSINRVNISGNLTRDPELRQTQSGMQVLGFGMAVNDRIKNQQTGEWEDRPNFVDCCMFGSRAEAVSKYLGKGAKVSIEGKLRWSQWEDKQGGKRSKLEVVVDELELMSQRQQAPQQAPQYQQPPQYQQAPQMAPQPAYAPQYAPQAAPQPQYQQPSVYDEEIPF